MANIPENEKYKINQRISIVRLSSIEGPEYFSNIQNIEKGIIYITIPYNEKEPLVLMRGEGIRVKYISEGAIYVFDSEFLGKHKESDTLLLYKIKEPDDDKIKRIQLRHFVRVPVIMDVKYKKNDADWVKTVMLDISGGGIKMATKEKIEPGKLLDLHFKIPAKKEMVDVNVKAEVVRCNLVDDETKLFYAGLKFLDLNQGMEDMICSFVFRKQIEQIRKRQVDF
ncbi:MAG: PilZ domain-containing protein [Desulfotomaculum sp.]|nr:PilZ domain-containing protein [Desulfotomaculum sp.]